MSKEITVTPLCPNHAERTVANIEVPLGLDNNGALVDMCADCFNALIPTLRLFMEDGQPIEQPKKKHGGGPGRQRSAPDIPDTTCPECGRDNFTSRHTRNSHLREQHDKSIREYG